MDYWDTIYLFRIPISYYLSNSYSSWGRDKEKIDKTFKHYIIDSLQ